MIFVLNLKNKMSYSKQVALVEKLPSTNVECYVAPVLPNFYKNSSWSIASQNVSVSERAVGELQPHILKHFNINHSFIGHLERRIYLNEELSIIKRKLSNALDNGIVPILVFGFEDDLGCIQELNYLLENVSLINKHIIFAYESLKSTLTGNKKYAHDKIQEIYTQAKQKIDSYKTFNFNFTYDFIFGGGVELEHLEDIITVGFDGILLGDRYVDSVTINSFVIELERIEAKYG